MIIDYTNKFLLSEIGIDIDCIGTIENSTDSKYDLCLPLKNKEPIIDAVTGYIYQYLLRYIDRKEIEAGKINIKRDFDIDIYLVNVYSASDLTDTEIVIWVNCINDTLNIPDCSCGLAAMEITLDEADLMYLLRVMGEYLYKSFDEDCVMDTVTFKKAR